MHAQLLIGCAVALLVLLTGGCQRAEWRDRGETSAAGTADGAIIPTVNGRAPCVVERVVDGDTFVCRGGSRVRLLLIDAPELAQDPYGERSAAALRAALRQGSQVELEFDLELHDRYDRILAYVHSGGQFVNREMVRDGMAVVTVYQPNVKYVELMRAAADTARAKRAGLWKVGAFDCTPGDFRAGRCR